MIPYKFLSVLVMPTDYCNMNCVYCFNSRKTNLEKKTMSYDTLQKIFSSTIPYYDEVKYIWHGGEPVSMGLEFYKKTIEFQKEINTNGTKISNSIQSNLTLLNDEYVQFFLTNGFKFGSSFDGIKNELTRHNTEKILSGRNIIIKNGGTVGFICVVQSQNIDYLIEDYIWFKNNNINYTLNQYMTPTPCNDALYVSPESYVKRICELFDYWANDKNCNISISYFEDFVEFFLFGKKKLCCYNSCMGKHVGIHYDGGIYNCNRDFPNEYSYGNIHDFNDIHECFETKGFQLMLKKAINRRNHCKENCEIYDFCTGGCNSTAYIGGNIERGNDYVCETTIKIYRYIENALSNFLQEQDNKYNLNPFLMKSFIRYKNGGNTYD